MGASSPEDFGLYFSWGNTEGHEEGSGYDFSQANYNASEAAAIETDLSLSQDMAHANLGQPWRLPSKEDFKELVDNCTSVWTTQNGVNGRLFTSNVNGNSIFFPATGAYDGISLIDQGSAAFYWSSTYESTLNALDLYFGTYNVEPQNSNGRRYGFNIRAVLT